MLSSDDSRVVEADATLSGLRVLLDDDALAEWCRSRGFGDVGVCNVQYARYKPNTSCVVHARMRAGGSEENIYVTCFGGGGVQKLRKAHEYASEQPARTARVAIDTERAIVGYRWPCDRELPVLERLSEQSTRDRLFEKLLGAGQAKLCWVLRYKPERRAVMRWSTDRGDVLVKAYAEGEFAIACSNAQATQVFLHCPRLLAVSERHRLLVFEWISEAEAAHVPQSAIASILTSLHGAPINLSGRCDKSAIKEVVTSSVTDASQLCPHLNDRLAHFTRQLLLAIDNVADGRRLMPIHGDCSSDQFLQTASATLLTDFDNACMGDPMMDLGNYLAKEWLLQLQSPESGTAQNDASRLLDAYAGHGGAVDVAVAKVYESFALLRVLTDGFRKRRANWRREAEQVLARAQEVLHGH